MQLGEVCSNDLGRTFNYEQSYTAVVWLIRCGTVGSMELWEVWNCGKCGTVGSMELWEVWNCGKCGTVGSTIAMVQVALL